MSFRKGDKSYSSNREQRRLKLWSDPVLDLCAKSQEFFWAALGLALPEQGGVADWQERVLSHGDRTVPSA